MSKPIDLGRQSPTCTARYHGTEAAYDHGGCRCPHARELHRIERKRQREGRRPSALTDATGTARRLQALVAIGWAYAQIGARLEVSDDMVRLWAFHTWPQVRRCTATMVRDLYRELCDRPGTSTRARRAATSNGWHSPAAWDNIDDPAEQPDTGPAPVDTEPDDVAVQRALAGQARYRRLHPADRIAAYRQLVAAGLGTGAIQGRLHINADTLRQLVDLAGQQEVAA